MFTSSDIKSLQEAYQAVYDDELRSEIVEDDDLFEDLEIIDELSDEELDEIVEEIVYEMLDEGYDFDDVEYIFEDVLLEARSARRRTGGPSYAEVMAQIDAKEKKTPKAKAKTQSQPEATRQSTSTSRSRRVGSSSGERMGAGRRGLTPRKQEERSARRTAEREAAAKSDRESARRERRERIGSAVKSALSKAGEMAKGVKQRISAKLRGAKAAAGIAGSIAKDEAKRARRSVEHQAGKAVDTAKSGLKGLIRRGAERVQRGAEGVARRMSEEVETFDIVVDFLLSEGIVETLEDAQWVMVNELDSEDIDAILEAYVDWRKGKLPSGRTPRQAATNRRDALDSKIESGNWTRKKPTQKDYDRAYKQSSTTREMDSHTSFGGKINKALSPGRWNSSLAGPRVAYGEPNTDRHQLARLTRDAVSRASSAQRRSRGG